MKTYIKIIVPMLFAGLLLSCAGTDDNAPETETVSIDELTIEMEPLKADSDQTRAISEYVVNQPTLDPTSDITKKQQWQLDVQIYDGSLSKPYQYGKASLNYSGSGNLWTPINLVDGQFHFPNYSTQPVTAKLYPTTPGWTEAVETDQSTESQLLLQDMMVQNGNPVIYVAPSHKPTVTVRHAFSMLDFIISDVTVDEILLDQVRVIVGSTEYIPYMVRQTPKLEYIVILPVGSANPVIRVKTVEGAIYNSRVAISTAINNCYCTKLIGPELVLGEITIRNWITGEAIKGDFSTVTSYPTFKGNPNTEITLHYRNGNSQDLEFNSDGEVTARPLGRTIVMITGASINDITLDPPLVLNTMIIDLKPILDTP